MMNTIYPNEGAQLHVNGAEAKPGMNMEGLLLSSRGVSCASSEAFRQSNQAENPTKIWYCYHC